MSFLRLFTGDLGFDLYHDLEGHIKVKVDRI